MFNINRSVAVAGICISRASGVGVLWKTRVCVDADAGADHLAGLSSAPFHHHARCLSVRLSAAASQRAQEVSEG